MCEREERYETDRPVPSNLTSNQCRRDSSHRPWSSAEGVGRLFIFIVIRSLSSLCNCSSQRDRSRALCWEERVFSLKFDAGVFFLVLFPPASSSGKQKLSDFFFRIPGLISPLSYRTHQISTSGAGPLNSCNKFTVKSTGTN